MPTSSFLRAFIALTSVALVRAADASTWRSQSIYQVLTDRFARTDGSTTASCNLNLYCGGSWQGLINQLDYIQNMGFTAIWISPVTQNINSSNSAGEAYHGYWQQDLYAVNENFGTASDLASLASELHSRNMLLMVDVVVNHFGFGGSSTAVDYSQYNPFNDASFFHSYCDITASPGNGADTTNLETCWLDSSTDSDSVCLPDAATENSNVASAYNSWITSLVSNYSIDGLRIDTVPYVDPDFWQGFESAAGVFCTGEVFDGDPTYVCPFQKLLDSVLNYPIYFPLTSAFESTSGDIGSMVNMVNTMKSDCSDVTVLGSFLDNQDNPRFASLTDDLALVQNAITYVLLGDGVPIVYYGTEQHFNGGGVPNNREALWTSGYSTDAPLYSYISKLNMLRQHAISAESSYLTYNNYPIYSDTTTIAMRKGENNPLIMVLSNKGSEGASYNQTISGTGYSDGDNVLEIVGCTSQTANTNGTLTISMGAGAPKIFYPSSALNGSGICGT